MSVCVCVCVTSVWVSDTGHVRGNGGEWEMGDTGSLGYRGMMTPPTIPFRYFYQIHYVVINRRPQTHYVIHVFLKKLRIGVSPPVS